MKYDEFHRLVRANGWTALRQLGTSHVIYKKGTEPTQSPTTEGEKWVRVWRER